MNNNSTLIKMNQLQQLLLENYPNRAITTYVSDTYNTLKHSEGVAFTGTLQQFLNTAPTILFSDGITLDDKTRQVWHDVLNDNHLGNNLWGTSMSL